MLNHHLILYYTVQFLNVLNYTQYVSMNRLQKNYPFLSDPQ
jgi:hypothetical protein